MAAPHSLAEERANYLTHGAGVFFSLIWQAFVLVASALHFVVVFRYVMQS